MDNIKAKIDYPLLRQSIDIELNDKDIEEMEEILENIKNIVKEKAPCDLHKKRICKSCAYYDLCFV